MITAPGLPQRHDHAESAGGSATVPAGAAHVDPLSAHHDAFVTKEVELSLALVRRAGAVRVQHTVPWDLGSVTGHHRADGASRSGTDVLRDVAVRHDPPA